MASGRSVRGRRRAVEAALRNQQEQEELWAEVIEDEEEEIGGQGQRAPVWDSYEITNLFLACNARKKQLKGSWDSAANGKRRRDEAWEAVSAYVTAGSQHHRSAADCEKKVSTFCSLTKEKNRRLMMLRRQSGGAEIPNYCTLAMHEELCLDYIGEPAVVGIPGIRGSPLVHSQPPPTDAVPELGPWDANRPWRPNYNYVDI